MLASSLAAFFAAALAALLLLADRVSLAVEPVSYSGPTPQWVAKHRAGRLKYCRFAHRPGVGRIIVRAAQAGRYRFVGFDKLYMEPANNYAGQLLMRYVRHYNRNNPVIERNRHGLPTGWMFKQNVVYMDYFIGDLSNQFFFFMDKTFVKGNCPSWSILQGY